jgi:hypothetical protein
MGTRVFDLAMHVPLPVGHRVEVLTFRKPQRSAWDGSIKHWEGDIPEREMVVRDLVTGIFYGMEWHFRESPTDRGGATPLAGLILVDRFEGTLAACRIMALGIDGRQETQLVVNTEPSAAPFR